jgi:DNA-binding transcriptional LysR family regulator
MIDWDEVRFFLAVARGGSVRVALPPTLATHLLMPDFVEFARLRPEIEMEILSGDEPVNLTNRQADVAIRVVFDRNNLPPNLHGLKGPELFGGVYMSRDLLSAWRAGAPDPVRWIVRNSDGVSNWARKGDVHAAEVPFRATDAAAQILAVRLGLGMAALSCFIGDADPLLVRVPGTSLRMFGTLWLLTQGESRKTKRVRLFTEFVSRRLAAHVPLLAGLSYSRD